MALESWMFGNPEDVAARREAHEQRKDAACGPCVHHMTLTVTGGPKYLGNVQQWYRD